MSNLFSNIIEVVFNLVIYVVNLLSVPIYSLINSALNWSNAGFTLDDVLQVPLDFFNTITSYANYFLSFTGLYQDYINVVILIWVFILTVPILVHTFKLAIKWFNMLKIG